MSKKVIRLQQVDSTNNFLCRHARCYEEDMVVVCADHQTAGRGQGSNGWESEAAKNLLFSIRIHPTYVPVQSQFLLSMAGALAIKDVLDGYVSGISMKWPNDIYWQNRKICGTLLEVSISGGQMKDCVYGVGLNVNQQRFLSDAPNPVSLVQILGHEVDRERLLSRIVEAFEHYEDLLRRGAYDEVVRRYHAGLYRRRGLHLYRDRHGCFSAAVKRVDTDGRLVLTDDAGNERSYYLKEITFIQE